ncbi:glutamate racemase [Demequina sp. TTPB684]|uniref:glutamate racemase n=1 Tax=unclassified Demequina TaxID=2620311 RepID=UPI001CF3330F|nr:MULTISPECIES: glutamate racemase [unclassified Demequina]MCB2413494.1 glutamate racemase [Demequina sp. TTPB684]UPU87186.1 glutamate racemase [Demequina sp. TMPB413]
MSDAPIGVFDSGVGGLTVARAIMDMMPHESIHYVGDTANGPYGPLPISQVREHALTIMDALVEDGVKLLVIACNTASAAVLRDARERFSHERGVPVVEVIVPAVRRAAGLTRSGRVGVIGTVATINSGAYDDALAAAPSVRVTSQACPRFVSFVEEGITSGQEVIDVAREYLEPLKQAEVDTLILGCTHYPMLQGALSYVMGEHVTLVDSATETAMDVYRALVASGLERLSTQPPVHRFLATGPTEAFEVLAQRFMGPVVRAVEPLRT